MGVERYTIFNNLTRCPSVPYEKGVENCRSGWSGCGRFPKKGVEGHTYVCSCYVKYKAASRKTVFKNMEKIDDSYG
jgi:hypothetical protein